MTRTLLDNYTPINYNNFLNAVNIKFSPDESRRKMIGGIYLERADKPYFLVFHGQSWRFAWTGLFFGKMCCLYQSRRSYHTPQYLVADINHLLPTLPVPTPEQIFVQYDSHYTLMDGNIGRYWYLTYAWYLPTKSDGIRDMEIFSITPEKLSLLAAKAVREVKNESPLAERMLVAEVSSNFRNLSNDHPFKKEVSKFTRILQSELTFNSIWKVKSK